MSRASVKDYRWSIIFLVSVIVAIALCTELLIPKATMSYNSEVKTIASVRTYYGYINCPNEVELDKIKTSYLNSIPEKDVNKRVWILKNFNSVYTEVCIKDN